MKKMNLIIIGMLLFGIISCRETSTNDKPKDTMNGTTPSGDTTSSIDNNANADGVVTYKQGDMENMGVMNQDMSQTYSELEMSKEQIETYQSNMGAVDETGNDNQSAYQDQQDKAMKSTLTDGQYDKYQMMKSSKTANDTNQ
jgi:hypothetical protein